MAEWFTPHIVRVLKGSADSASAAANLSTAGTGVLVATGKVLTCAHVVAYAMADDDSAQSHIESASSPPTESIWLLLNPLSENKQFIRAKVECDSAWSPLDSTAKQKLQDAALLTIIGGEANPSILNLSLATEKQYARDVGFFGFSEFEEDERWENGVYEGPCQRFEQIKVEGSRAWHGYSGGGVFCKQDKILLGMLVAAPVSTDKYDIYMMHSVLLVPFLKANGITSAPVNATQKLAEHVEDHASIKILSEMLNRSEQVNFMERFLYPEEYQNQKNNDDASVLAPLCGMVFESTTEDLPQFLAHKLMARQRFKGDNFNKLPPTAFRAITMMMNVGESFTQKLNDSVGGSVERWFKINKCSLVVYLAPSLPDKTVEVVQDVIGELERLYKKESNPNAKILVLIPFFSSELNVLSRFLYRRKLREACGIHCTVTNPLSEITQNDINHFWEGIPVPARSYYQRQFDHMPLDVTDQQIPKKGARYQSFAKDFRQLLSNSYQRS